MRVANRLIANLDPEAPLADSGIGHSMRNGRPNKLPISHPLRAFCGSDNFFYAVHWAIEEQALLHWISINPKCPIRPD
jgi:hypothetical protein